MAIIDSSHEWIESATIFAGFLAGAGLIHVAALLVSRRWSSKMAPSVKQIVKPLRLLVQWGLVLTGLNYAVQYFQFTQEHPTLSHWAERGLAIAWIILATVTLVRLSVGWFALQTTAQDSSQSTIDQHATPRKLVTGVFVTLGGLYALQVAGVDLGPLMAGGAVSGIIIGLALQDTLSNFFAGFFINIDRPFRVGDQLVLEGDREGFVESIGWRYTRIRLQNDTVLMIPNGKFSQSAFVNLNESTGTISTHVEVSVAPTANLATVESIAMQVGSSVQAELANQSEVPPPLVRWRSFNELAVTLRVIVHVSDSSQLPLARSMTIRQLLNSLSENRVPLATAHIPLAPIRPTIV